MILQWIFLFQSHEWGNVRRPANDNTDGISPAKTVTTRTRMKYTYLFSRIIHYLFKYSGWKPEVRKEHFSTPRAAKVVLDVAARWQIVRPLIPLSQKNKLKKLPSHLCRMSEQASAVYLNFPSNKTLDGRIVTWLHSWTSPPGKPYTYLQVAWSSGILHQN